MRRAPGTAARRTVRRYGTDPRRHRRRRPAALLQQRRGSRRRHGLLQRLQPPLPLEDWLGDILEHTGTGHLVRLRPGGTPEVVLDGLQFANGVALAPDESYVTVAETGARRLSRLWLTGPQAGQHDILAADLPGYPDNMSRGPGGLFWVALAGPRSTGLDRLHRTKPALRHAAWSVTRRVRPRPGPLTGVLAVDTSGHIVHDLRRRSPDYRMVTSVCEHEGHLILGSIHEHALAVCELPGTPRD
ncbi:SMP-30/gluconolactonase/LRE family protein [Streptomyces sp. Ac-502]|uniref:SMP-30/gluconolactonase/LRE family protein n=1 Tax=Streptomyces sp. Ac-502 TaxID=3342801 RepID=UPI0038623BCD